jgi:RNA polymerase sigma-70 factor (ECF subfamily)
MTAPEYYLEMIRQSTASHKRPPTRRSLLLRLRDWNDQGSWQEFSKIYERLIYDTAMQAGLKREEAQEVVQETLLSVAKKIAGFSYDPEVGTFRSWLLQITRRRIVDQLRKRSAHHAAGNGTVQIEQLSDVGGSKFDEVWNAEWHQALLDMARALVRRTVSEKQFRMFELYVLQQAPIKKVMKDLNVSAAQVYMAKYRIGMLLKKQLRALEKEL